MADQPLPGKSSESSHAQVASQFLEKLLAACRKVRLSETAVLELLTNDPHTYSLLASSIDFHLVRTANRRRGRHTSQE